MKKLFIPVVALSLAACNQSTNTQEEASNNTPPAMETQVSEEVQSMASSSLDDILASQDEEAKKRFSSRHPKETLEFFGIESGMTVVEALPGEGWYSKILLPLIGAEGKLIGVDYAMDMWPKFGFFDEKFIEERKTWGDTWTADASQWGIQNGAELSASVFGSFTEDQHGTADAVLFIRAFHNLSRFEDDGGFCSTAMDDAFNLLKPGGILGVVQHQAAEDKADDWSRGQNGYLKKSILIAQLSAAGFEFVDESDINTNAKDQPSESDVVWRLPPTYFTSKDNPELRQELEAVGESNRMTLKFRKPIKT